MNAKHLLLALAALMAGRFCAAQTSAPVNEWQSWRRSLNQFAPLLFQELVC